MIDSPAYRRSQRNGAAGRATRAARSLAAVSWLQQPHETIILEGGGAG